MARDYGNAVTETPITGFPSACAEYAEKDLSLDEFFNVGASNVVFHYIHNDFKEHRILKGDLLHIDTALPVKVGQLVIVVFEGEVGVFRKNHNGLSPNRLADYQLENAQVFAVTGLSRDTILKE